jgi:hypothetical protein
VEKGDRTLGREGRERRPDTRRLRPPKLRCNFAGRNAPRSLDCPCGWGGGPRRERETGRSEKKVGKGRSDTRRLRPPELRCNFAGRNAPRSLDCPCGWGGGPRREREIGHSEEKVRKGDRTLGKEGREREIGHSEKKVGKGDRTLGREGRERRPDARKRR